MNKNYLTYFILSTLFITIGCNKKKISTAYFTGQIVNPKEKHLHFYKNNKEIKNVILNNKHNFYLKLDSVKEGLYTFKHGSELQYIYLSPNDSLVMRLNTWDFDESLIYSGKGAIKNNFLMHLFLENEKQEKLFYSYYNLNEEDFLKKTDSLLQIKLLAYKQYKETEIHKTKKFDELINLAIYYPIYSQKEKYARRQRQKNKTLRNNFYDFREKININQDDFSDFYAFRNYVKNYFQNTSEKSYNSDKSQVLSLIMLKQINKKLENNTLKDELLQNATINCLLDEKCNLSNKQKALKIFFQNCKDKKKINEIKKISNTIDFIKKGDQLPTLHLRNFDNKPVILQAKDIKQNTIIYFWPKEHNRIHFMNKRIHYLQKKYPTLRFIGIDGQLDNYNWKSYIKSKKISDKDQFKLGNKEAKNWYCNELPRAIIIDSKGTIQNNYSYISQKDFESLLNKLSNN